MKLNAIWSFIAGDSRRAPLAVACAVIVTIGLERYVPSAGPLVGVVFVALIAVGLVAGVFERV